MSEGTAAADDAAAGPPIEYACTVEVRITARSVTEARIKLDQALTYQRYRLDAITPTGQPAGWPEQASDQCGGQ